ncbi:unnamed protein product, partial [Heterosigma akashiwo]
MALRSIASRAFAATPKRGVIAPLLGLARATSVIRPLTSLPLVTGLKPTVSSERNFATITYSPSEAKIGKPAPTFKAGAVAMARSQRLILVITGKWTVLLFYPKDFTFCLPHGDHRLLGRRSALQGPERRGLGPEHGHGGIAPGLDPHPPEARRAGAHADPHRGGRDQGHLGRLRRAAGRHRHCAPRAVPDQPGGRAGADHGEQPARGPLGGRDPPPAAGLPVRGRTRRGVPRGLEARGADHGGPPGRGHGLLQGRGGTAGLLRGKGAGGGQSTRAGSRRRLGG